MYRREEEFMQAEKLLHYDKDEFISFCLRNRNKVDDSFLYDENMKTFVPDEDNPTFIVKKDNSIIAGISLILDDYHRRGKRGRFRIFYSEVKDQNIYCSLLSELLKHINGIDKVFIFVPFMNSELSDIIKRLNFKVERFVYLLIKEITEPQVIHLPEGYSIREFQPNKDEEEWCFIRNTAFANLKGNSTPVTKEMVQKLVSSSDYLEGGLLFLMHNNNPVGIIRGAKEDYNGESVMNIGPLAILPSHQGKGLGRQLLRASIDFADKKNYKKTMLCVNAENEKAKELYLKEGFIQVEGVVAYEYPINGEL